MASALNRETCDITAFSRNRSHQSALRIVQVDTLLGLLGLCHRIIVRGRIICRSVTRLIDWLDIWFINRHIRRLGRWFVHWFIRWLVNRLVRRLGVRLRIVFEVIRTANLNHSSDFSTNFLHNRDVLGIIAPK